VGLRWWNEMKEDGSEQWIFESMDVSKNKIPIKSYILSENTNKSDNRVFWVSSYLTPAIWFLLIIVSILKFNLQNVSICVLAVGLSLTNLMGYIKCEKNHQQKLKGFLYN
jgi:hypothetical protein